MKCWHCEAQNLRHSSICWACGIQLQRQSRRATSFQPEAMRHYTTATVAMRGHRAWLDGVVLLSTILFGLLLGYFVADVLPNREGAVGTASPMERLNAALTDTPFSFLVPSARSMPIRPIGEAQSVNSLVTQVAQVRRAKSEAGREAPANAQFLTATVVIDNQSARPLAYNLNDFKVRDSRGRSITPQAINSAGWLSSGRVAPGQNVQGAVTFAVPESDTGLQVTFAPAGLGAQLRWDASGQ